MGRIMSICIIGAGLAGLAAAIKLKLTYPVQEIVLLDNYYSGSNTQIAGQRYRARASGQGINPIAEISQLLASRNEGKLTHRMEQFAKLSASSLEFWTTVNPREFGIELEHLIYTDNPIWFGPQFGRSNKAGFGRGKSVLSWFKKFALGLNIQLLSAETFSITRINNKILYISALLKENENDHLLKPINIYADYFILAGGNLGGRMFLSTNAHIYNSPQELAFNAGIPLVDSTLFMFHIVGYCTSEGDTKTGCFELDNLAGFQVYLKNISQGQFNILDERTTELLKEHKAHYFFEEIARRFIQHGGMIKLTSNESENENLFARVSHHYSHIAVQTSDGVTVSGVDNLFAVGDASGLGYWTERNIRLTGFALTKCLTDADWILDKEAFSSQSTGIKIEAMENSDEALIKDRKTIKVLEGHLRKLNTEFLFKIIFSDDAINDSQQWINKLFEVSAKINTKDSTLFSISLCTAYSFWNSLTSNSANPDVFSKKTLKQIKSIFEKDNQAIVL